MKSMDQMTISSPLQTYRLAGKLTVVCALLFFVAFFAWVLIDAGGYICLCRAERPKLSRQVAPQAAKWPELRELAKRAGVQTISQLPAEVLATAQSVVCILDKWPLDQRHANVLGLYFGFTANRISEGGRI